MFKSSSLTRRYCKECGNVTHYSVTKRERPDHSQSYAFIGISLLIITILGLAKLFI